MSEPLLGLLGTVLTAVGGGGIWILRALLTDILATNRSLRETNAALIAAMASMGQRLTRVESGLAIQGNMIEDMHRELCGTKRTSDYAALRAAINRKDGEG